MFAVVAFATEEVSTVLAPVSEVKVTDFIQSDTIKTQTSVKVFVYNKDTLLKEVNEGVKVARFNAKSGDTTNVIVFVDGVQKDKEMINQIDPDDISEVRVLKGEKAIEQYGGIAKDGIIIITTKYSEKRGEDDVKVVEKVVVKMSDTDAKPLYVIDGALQEKVELNDINPKNIESIKVLKGEVALKKFGEKGKNGVILITLKK